MLAHEMHSSGQSHGQQRHSNAVAHHDRHGQRVMQVQPLPHFKSGSSRSEPVQPQLLAKGGNSSAMKQYLDRQ